MLDTLDDIDWGRLEHAYGSAADVPDMIRRLADPDEDVRDEAFYEAYGNIFHQGSRYQATAPAVPFLLELLAAPDYPSRDSLLYLLAALTIGYDDIFIPGGLHPELAYWRARHEQLTREGDESETWPSEADWLGWTTDIYDAVSEGLPRFIDALADESEAVRAASAYLLAWLPEARHASSAPLLNTAQRDEDDDVRATALISLALSTPPGSTELHAHADAIGVLLDDPAPVVRFGAAFALAARLPDHPARAKALDVLIEAVGLAGEEDGAHWSLPFHDGDFGSVAADLLVAVAADDAETIVDALLPAIDTMSTPQAAHVATAGLQLVFPEGFGGDPASLSALQRRFLEGLAGTRAPWFFDDDTVFGNFVLTMRDFGLPASLDALRELLAKS